MRYEDVDWSAANCAGTDPVVWFQHDRYQEMRARICRICWIREECEAWAVANNEAGFWGGRYFRQRVTNE